MFKNRGNAEATSWFTVNGKKTVIGKTSRRFKELDLEILHRFSMGYYATLQDFFFLLFDLFRRFSGAPFFRDYIRSDPIKSELYKKNIPAKLRNDPWNICAQFQGLTP